MPADQATRSAVDEFLASLSGLLGPLSPFAKAIVPAAAALIASLVNVAFTGSFDATSITIAASGLVLALVAYLVPNRTKAHAPPSPPAQSVSAPPPPLPGDAVSTPAGPQPSPTGAITPIPPPGP